MKRFLKHSLFLVLVCFGQKTVLGQKTVILDLQPKHVHINSSSFSNVEVIDSRLDTANLGFIQTGAIDREKCLNTSRPLKDELALVVNKMISSASKQDGTLLINLRQLATFEHTDASGEFGVLRLSAVFYLKQATEYRKVATVNTRIIVKSLWDVTNKLLDTIPEVFGAFVKQVASFDSAHCDSMSRFTAKDYTDLDGNEKKMIPVYQVEMPQKGLYDTYEAFKNNHPSRQVIIVPKRASENILVYEMRDDGKKGVQINFNNFYAVCDGAKIFISTPHALRPLSKNDNDFYFTGIGGDAGPSSYEPDPSVIPGRLARAPFAISTVEFKIDHITGLFIPVKWIERDVYEYLEKTRRAN